MTGLRGTAVSVSSSEQPILPNCFSSEHSAPSRPPPRWAPQRLCKAGSLCQQCVSPPGEGNGNPLQCSCLEHPRDGEPGGLPSRGSHRVGHDGSDLAAAAAAAEGRQAGRQRGRVETEGEGSRLRRGGLPQKNSVLLTPRSQTLHLQSCEKADFCALNPLVCGSCGRRRRRQDLPGRPDLISHSSSLPRG